MYIDLCICSKDMHVGNEKCSSYRFQKKQSYVRLEIDYIDGWYRWIHNTVKLPGVKVRVSCHLFRSVLQPPIKVLMAMYQC